MFASLSSSCHHVFFRFNLSFLHQFMWFMYVHVRFSPFQVILAFLLSTFSVVSRNSRWRRWLSCKMLRNSARQSPQGSGIFWWHDPCFRRTFANDQIFLYIFRFCFCFLQADPLFSQKLTKCASRSRNLETAKSGICNERSLWVESLGDWITVAVKTRL